MIEQGRLPLIAVVTSSAVIHPFSELIAVRIFVAIKAMDRCFREIDVLHGYFEIRRLVAICAADRSMRSNQREARLLMIEVPQVFPILCGMTRLASHGFTGRVMHRHALGELSAVRIFVTRRAAELLEVIQRYRCTGQWLMALDTSHCDMTSS